MKNMGYLVPAPWRHILDRCTLPAVPEPAYPPPSLRFRALSGLSPEKVRVVILGQDPYHGKGEANGLAFSVSTCVRIPPSLRNIFKELDDDIGSRGAGRSANPDEDFLSHWVKQGVLLLNTSLSVAPDAPGSHSAIGWHMVTDEILRTVNACAPAAVFILWGAHAQKRRTLVDESRHLVLASAHPSPLSAYRGFFGSRPFSKANEWLASQGQEMISW